MDTLPAVKEEMERTMTTMTKKKGNTLMKAKISMKKEERMGDAARMPAVEEMERTTKKEKEKPPMKARKVEIFPDVEQWKTINE